MEGQQRFDNHVDKLMNYIRYWQASGESLKTSIRTKTRLGQLTEEGHYTGGTVPYGYRAVDKGRVNKRNRTVLDLEIDEDEAEVIRLIFHKYVDEGYGAQRLSHYLHEQGIKAATEKAFRTQPSTGSLRTLPIPVSSKTASHSPAILTSYASSTFPPFPRHRRSCASGRSRMATCR